jgi:hypothetical protein
MNDCLEKYVISQCSEMSKTQSFTFEKTNKKHLNLSKLYFNLFTTNQLTYY